MMRQVPLALLVVTAMAATGRAQIWAEKMFAVRSHNSLYPVPITFTAADKMGKITRTIRIETDADQTILTVRAHAMVGS